jgi:hypothetical protein
LRRGCPAPRGGNLTQLQEQEQQEQEQQEQEQEQLTYGHLQRELFVNGLDCVKELEIGNAVRAG